MFSTKSKLTPVVQCLFASSEVTVSLYQLFVVDKVCLSQTFQPKYMFNDETSRFRAGFKFPHVNCQRVSSLCGWAPNWALKLLTEAIREKHREEISESDCEQVWGQSPAQRPESVGDKPRVTTKALFLTTGQFPQSGHRENPPTSQLQDPPVSCSSE